MDLIYDAIGSFGSIAENKNPYMASADLQSPHTTDGKYILQFLFRSLEKRIRAFRFRFGGHELCVGQFSRVKDRKIVKRKSVVVVFVFLCV